MSSLNVEHNLLENMDYLQELARTCSNKDPKDFDSNLLYEVGYAKLYIDKMIVSWGRPSDDLLQLSTLFDSVMEMADKSVEINTDTREYKKLLKMRYEDVDSASYDIDKPYDGDFPIRNYLIRRFPSIAVLSLMMFLILDGRLFSFMQSIFSGKVESAEVVNGVVNQFSGAVSTVLSVVAMMCIMCMSLTIMLDLLYISMPMMRVFLGNREARFVSSDAVASVNGEKAYMKKVKSVDRINRNKYWLDSMLSVLDKKSDMYNCVKELSDSIKKMKKNSSEYYYSMAKIEFYRNKCLELGLI